MKWSPGQIRAVRVLSWLRLGVGLLAVIAAVFLLATAPTGGDRGATDGLRVAAFVMLGLGLLNTASVSFDLWWILPRLEMRLQGRESL